MTAATSDKLADALLAEGFGAIAERARRDEFHDFLSPHDFPAIMLVRELRHCGRKGRDFAKRVEEGEFDATREEGAAWLATDEGQEALRSLSRRG